MRARRQEAGIGGDHEVTEALLARDDGGDAPGGVAAGRGLAAVRVEDAHEDVGVGRQLEHDQLVAADAAMPVRDADDALGIQAERTVATVDDDEVVADAVHLAEGERVHGGRT